MAVYLLGIVNCDECHALHPSGEHTSQPDHIDELAEKYAYDIGGRPAGYRHVWLRDAYADALRAIRGGDPEALAAVGIFPDDQLDTDDEQHTESVRYGQRIDAHLARHSGERVAQQARDDAQRITQPPQPKPFTYLKLPNGLVLLTHRP